MWSKSIRAHTQYAEYVNQIFFYRTRVKKNLVANHRKLYCVRGTSSFSVAETYLGKNNALVQIYLTLYRQSNHQNMDTDLVSAKFEFELELVEAHANFLSTTGIVLSFWGLLLCHAF